MAVVNKPTSQPYVTVTGTVPNPLPAVSGVNLTNLNASELKSGSLDDARLHATVLLASAGVGSPAAFSAGGATHTVTIVGGQIISWTMI